MRLKDQRQAAQDAALRRQSDPIVTKGDLYAAVNRTEVQDALIWHCHQLAERRRLRGDRRQKKLHKTNGSSKSGA